MHKHIQHPLHMTWTVDLVLIVQSSQRLQYVQVPSTEVPLPPTKHLKLYESTLCWSTVYCLCIQYLVHLLLITVSTLNRSTPCSFTKRAFRRQHRKCNKNDFLNSCKSAVTCHLHCMAEWKKERFHTTSATTRMVSEIAIPAKSERTDRFLKVIWTQAVRLKEFKSIRIYINDFV